MENEKIKLIIKNIESLIDCLKKEIYLNEVSKLETINHTFENDDYDEIYQEDEDF